MPRQSRSRIAVGLTASLLCLLFVGLATWTLTAQLPATESLEVTELVLVNADGDRRATLSLVEDRPVLELFDPDGSLQLTLGLSAEGPALLIKDKAGEVHNFLGLEAVAWPTPSATR